MPYIMMTLIVILTGFNNTRKYLDQIRAATIFTMSKMYYLIK